MNFKDITNHSTIILLYWKFKRENQNIFNCFISKIDKIKANYRK